MRGLNIRCLPEESNMSTSDENMANGKQPTVYQDGTEAYGEVDDQHDGYTLTVNC